MFSALSVEKLVKPLLGLGVGFALLVTATQTPAWAALQRPDAIA